MAQAATEPTDTVTVFMIGDSTMANKPLDKENQERGWGQMLPVYLQGLSRSTIMPSTVVHLKVLLMKAAGIR